MLNKLPETRVLTETFVCQGGLDTQTPASQCPPGRVRSAKNFMAVSHGYTRIPGYERFDGHASPTDRSRECFVLDARHSLVASSPITTVTGKSSGATGILLAREGTRWIMVSGDGDFLRDEDLADLAREKILGVCDGYADLPPPEAARYRGLAADYWRGFIRPVPGSGPIRGVCEFQNTIYAFRDNVEATQCRLFKSSENGWEPVDTPELPPGGDYEFVNANFGGAAPLERLYGVSGTHPAFAFDGETLTLLSTGTPNDTPTHLTAHRGHLFLSFGESVQFLPAGDPATPWSALTGAGEIAIGDLVTGFVPSVNTDTGSVLLIATRNAVFALHGSSFQDWNLVLLDGAAGAVPRTLQKMGQPLALSDSGIHPLTSRTGNLPAANLSKNVHDLIIEQRGHATASCVSWEFEQYRLFFDDGTALFVTPSNKKDEPPQIMPIAFPCVVRCVCSKKNGEGSETLFFGSDDGHVYQMDKGSSFDGQPIPCLLEFAFNGSRGAQNTRKRYRKLVLEFSGTGYAEIAALVRFGARFERVSQPADSRLTKPDPNDWNHFDWDHFAWDRRAPDLSIYGHDWNTLRWGEFCWDRCDTLPLRIDIPGAGENFSLRLAGRSADFDGFTLQNVTVTYSPRRRPR